VTGADRRRVRAAALLALVVTGAHAGSPAEDPRLAQSRELVARFQGELSGRLKEALAAGGPVHAIDVCSRDAPAIAARLSAESGATVGRITAAARNPANAAGGGELKTLEAFGRALAEGEVEAPWKFEVASDGSATFTKAIVTQPACLACHGGTLAPDVASAVARRYPADEATGFAAGDLRGAFVVRWPAAEPERAP
jgi:hypothetical protein